MFAGRFNGGRPFKQAAFVYARCRGYLRQGRFAFGQRARLIDSECVDFLESLEIRPGLS